MAPANPDGNNAGDKLFVGMKNFLRNFEQIFVTRHLLFWTLIAVPVALLAGSAVALFLWLLDFVTVFRWQHEWLLYLLPLAGVLIHFMYKAGGKNAEAGNNLIMDEIHQPGGGVPARMAPLVLATTIITHLFGGSAGREGTAVQMGGSMAQLLGRWFRLKKEDVRIVLMMGVAAGFGAVFGTPLTGAVFALEVPAVGRIKYNALLPCLMASVFADLVCSAWGIHHTQYVIHTTASFDYLLLLKVILAGVAFGLAGNLFATATHRVKKLGNHVFKGHTWLMPVAGGLLVILLTFAAGTQDYLGLGVSSKDPGGISILNAFQPQGVNDWSWLWKLVFTAVTLGMGFKGGEVTPLFFVGAALGHTIGVYTGVPVDLLAGLGFIAVFAGATNTPIACTLMGVELFGPDHVLLFAVACFTAYYFSGHSGIYSAQRTAVLKWGEDHKEIPRP